jgi:hypothetical protein
VHRTERTVVAMFLPTEKWRIVKKHHIWRPKQRNTEEQKKRIQIKENVLAKKVTARVR